MQPSLDYKQRLRQLFFPAPVSQRGERHEAYEAEAGGIGVSHRSQVMTSQLLWHSLRTWQSFMR